MNINRLKPGLHIYIGVPGSGKTTLASALCYKFMHSRKFKGKNCYSNVPILGTLKYSPREHMGKTLLEDGLIICDEAGIEFNGRSWKSMAQDCIEFAKTYRHYGLVHFCFFSQALDIDQTFIRLANSAHLCHKILFWVFVRDYEKILVQDENQQFIYGWRPVPFIRGGLHAIFAPKYWKLFDTYEYKPLPISDYPLWDNVNRYPDFYPQGSAVGCQLASSDCDSSLKVLPCVSHGTYNLESALSDSIPFGQACYERKCRRIAKNFRSTLDMIG